MESLKDAQVFLIVSTVGHYSLFPLLFTQAGKLIKTVILRDNPFAQFIKGTISSQSEQTFNGAWNRCPSLR